MLFMELMTKALSGQKGMVDASTFSDNADMMGFLGGFTVKRLLSMMGTMGAKPLTRDQMLEFNAKLNKIRKKD